MPGAGEPVVAVPAPGAGPGWWAGAPAAALDDDGSILLAYRVRNGHDGNDQTVVARSADGVSFETLVVLDESHFDAMYVERPSFVRTRRRLAAVRVLRDPDSRRRGGSARSTRRPSRAWPTAEVVTAFAPDLDYAVKDPIVRRGRRAVGGVGLLPPPRHPGRGGPHVLPLRGVSRDGLDWEWQSTVMSGTPGHLGRPRRPADRVVGDLAAYDGRASAEENWFERTGIARRGPDGVYAPLGDAVADVRYLEVVGSATSRTAATRVRAVLRGPAASDESHELRDASSLSARR